MSNRIRNIPGKQVVRAFQRLGWIHTHTTGDHVYLRSPETGAHVSIPVVRNTPVKMGLLHNLLLRNNISEDAFITALRSK